jgi:hypothetical protein
MIKLTATPHILALMSEEDRERFGHPRDEVVPPMKTDRLERKEQGSFANYCLLHDLPFVWHATNTKSKASVGTPDFWCGINRCGIWVEFKRDFSCKLSKDQEEFARKLEAQGLKLYVVYSAAEAIALLQSFDRVI